MIPIEVYRLACAIGKCGPDDEPDDECVRIAWELVNHLDSNGYRIVKEPQP